MADWIAILHSGKLQVVAPLEELKTQVRTLSFSMRDPLLAEPIELDRLQIIHRSSEGRSHRMLVRNLSEEIEASLMRDANLFDVKVIRPNLEELYIGFTQPAPTPPPHDKPRIHVA